MTIKNHKIKREKIFYKEKEVINSKEGEMKKIKVGLDMKEMLIDLSKGKGKENDKEK
jgi:hypothetical protein